MKAPAPAAPKKHSRLGAAWVAIVISALVLILLLIFLLQNTTQVGVHYFGWDGSLPLGLAMTFAAVAGALLVALPGTIRILQLRKRYRKTQRL